MPFFITINNYLLKVVPYLPTGFADPNLDLHHLPGSEFRGLGTEPDPLSVCSYNTKNYFNLEMYIIESFKNDI